MTRSISATEALVCCRTSRRRIRNPRLDASTLSRFTVVVSLRVERGVSRDVSPVWRDPRVTLRECRRCTHFLLFRLCECGDVPLSRVTCAVCAPARAPCSTPCIVSLLRSSFGVDGRTSYGLTSRSFGCTVCECVLKKAFTPF